MIAPSYRVSALVGVVLVALILPADIRSAASPTPATVAVDEKLFNGMRWRQVGPFRGGRALAVEGVAGGAGPFFLRGGGGGGGGKDVWGAQLQTPFPENPDSLHRSA